MPNAAQKVFGASANSLRDICRYNLFMPDLYSVSAKYYDEAYATLEDLRDLQFYLGMARRTGGPVLELGCGTGRVLLPIAQQGLRIDGVDGSPAMLDQLQQKLAREPQHVRERATTSVGDLRSYRSERKYALVIIPFRPLQHMYTVEDQLAALNTAAFHLGSGGLLAFDVFYPRFESLLAGVGEETLELQWIRKDDPTTTVRRYLRKESVDKINQNFSAQFIYRTYRDDKLINEETAPLKMSYYTYPHLRALFLLAGLEIAEEYGSSEKAPLDNDSKEMVFVLQRSSANRERKDR
jgi:SAM-dependent methyltransferase